MQTIQEETLEQTLIRLEKEGKTEITRVSIEYITCGSDMILANSKIEAK